MANLISRFHWLFTALFICLPLLSANAEPRAEARLETDVALPGEPVRLEVSVEGGGSGSAPRIEVEGLEISHIGKSSQMQFSHPGGMQQTTVHHYEIIPKKSGEFTIPALSLRVDGQTVKTRPLTLTVNRSGRLPGGSPNATDDDEPQTPESAPITAEWLIPRPPAYVGEIVPAELRLYIRRDIEQQARIALRTLPQFEADGLVLREFPREPRTTSTERNGHTYEVVVFKTSISAVKAGDLKLSNTTIGLNLQVMEQQRSGRQRRPGIIDPFDFGPFGRRMVNRQVEVKADDVSIAVKALPQENRPANFSGAVGRFALSATAKPLQGKVGDPITLTTTVSGEGSFNRMTAPSINTDGGGWHIYPPTHRFEPDDDIEISGTKTFEQAIIPERPVTALPPVEFSYFDPVEAKYKTLRAELPPAEITGSPAPVATPTPAVASATPTPATPPASDILHIRTDGPGRFGSFTPVWRTSLFIGFQVIPLGLLLLGGYFGLRKRWAGDRVRQRRNALKAEKQTALRALRDESLPAISFYEQGVCAIRAIAALQRDDLSEEADLHAILKDRALSEESGQILRETFERHDEHRYARVADAPVTPERRAALLAALAELEKSHAL